MHSKLSCQLDILLTSWWNILGLIDTLSPSLSWPAATDHIRRIMAAQYFLISCSSDKSSFIACRPTEANIARYVSIFRCERRLQCSARGHLRWPLTHVLLAALTVLIALYATTAKSLSPFTLIVRTNVIQYSGTDTVSVLSIFAYEWMNDVFINVW